ncbi:MAG: ABC transporter ATP-binding protein [Pseudomonadota bacterium]
MARIELDRVAKRWGDVTAVEPTDLAIADGEFVAVLGPSGCGKSTTLFMLAGIYAPSEGSIRFDAAVVNDVEARHRNVGIVFQSYALYPHMTVAKNIRFPLRFRGVQGADAERRVREAAALVRVDDLLERMPGQLSGGQQQRVALARALVKEPQLLLLDEPLSNLDATLRLAMRSEIKTLQRKLGVTTVLVTHDQIEATTMADRIICMAKGTIQQIGTADDLYRRPASLFVAGFIGSPPMNLVGGEAAGGRLRVGDRDLEVSAASGPVVLGIRPEHLTLGAPGMPGEVVDVEPMGREALYVVDTPLGRIRALAPAQATGPRIGEGTTFRVDDTDALLFDAASEALLPDARIGFGP